MNEELLMVDAVFIGLSVLTVGSALFAIESREIIYGAISLAISMLGIAGFFILLDAPFVAMFQIAVYVGAVAVLVIFIVMLVRTQALFTATEDRGRRIAGLIFSLMMMAGIGVVIFSSEFSKAEFNPLMEKIVTKIGTEMLTYYSLPFVLLGLTLAGAIIGALSLARREEIDIKSQTSSSSTTSYKKSYLDQKTATEEQK
ncbi:MAG TPA: NADH-quinone oxidoreductase subunit J [Nitrososphaeraceae archaeon]|nr:NADH-quinone oxidoreductase subunit J [Nitrososphaeraceae archaeon]